MTKCLWTTLLFWGMDGFWNGTVEFAHSVTKALVRSESNVSGNEAWCAFSIKVHHKGIQ